MKASWSASGCAMRRKLCDRRRWWCVLWKFLLGLVVSSEQVILDPRQRGKHNWSNIKHGFEKRCFLTPASYWLLISLWSSQVLGWTLSGLKHYKAQETFRQRQKKNHQLQFVRQSDQFTEHLIFLLSLFWLIKARKPSPGAKTASWSPGRPRRARGAPGARSEAVGSPGREQWTSRPKISGDDGWLVDGWLGFVQGDFFNDLIFTLDQLSFWDDDGWWWMMSLLETSRPGDFFGHLSLGSSQVYDCREGQWNNWHLVGFLLDFKTQQVRLIKYCNILQRIATYCNLLTKSSATCEVRPNPSMRHVTMSHFWSCWKWLKVTVWRWHKSSFKSGWRPQTDGQHF